MNALEISRKQVVTAKGSTSLTEVASLMRQNHVGCVVVTGNGNGSERKPVGIVTDRDIVMEVVAMGLDASTMTASDIMSQSPAVSQAADDALWALKMMRDRGVRRLPVVDAKGELAGIVAFDDLMQHVGTTLGDIAQVIGSERSIEASRRV